MEELIQSTTSVAQRLHPKGKTWSEENEYLIELLYKYLNTCPCINYAKCMYYFSFTAKKIH